jgi:copper chaperone NosL
MGAEETVPFSDKGAAEEFAARNGGKVITFAQVPRDYVLGGGTATTSTVEDAPAPPHGHGSAPGQKAGHSH